MATVFDSVVLYVSEHKKYQLRMYEDKKYNIKVLDLMASQENFTKHSKKN